jgi:acyl carrier protein
MIQLGGEPLYKADLEHYKKHFASNCILRNGLSGNEMGPICQYWITKKTEINSSIVPVGYPVEGKKIVLLDDEQRKVGVNQIGEIAVTSRYLSSGYWNKSELTKDKFLAGDECGDERFYLSGDLGRMLPDGCVIYLGRKDDQIKIRGAKVEIGEVQAVLSEHPQIKYSAIVAYDRSGGDKYLAAYVVPGELPAPSVTEVTEYLKKKLPNYMIPSAFIFLESLPLSNGKLDRQALSKPDDGRPMLGTLYIAPRNEIEERLVQVWQNVLDVRPIGIDDNFFDLGGHSLAASRVISRVIQTFQMELPVKALFDAPTVAEMAAIITQNQTMRASDAELAQMLGEVEAMTDEEARQQLAADNARCSNGQRHE